MSTMTVFCATSLETTGNKPLFSACQKVPGQQQRGTGEVSPSLQLQNTTNRKFWSFAIADSMTSQVKPGTAEVRHPVTGPCNPISSEMSLQGYFSLQFSIFFIKLFDDAAI
jgi:hypothetical protein